MASSRYSVRLATLSDSFVLRGMLYEAAAPVGKDRPSPEQLLSNPQVTAFVDGWGRGGDHGLIAEADLEPVGAAWFRVFPDDDPEGGFVGGETPELLISLVPEHRGKGVGGMMMTELIQMARDEDKASLGLNVPRGNMPAVALFRRFGFEVRRDRDGVLTMQLTL
ncbi:MAG TPA: GNAT family N-acetyltransferase [Acidimicrobiales bacterium]|nr:GNAT family N-acetyltransferase [Acidimicrobiales bacterium]